ncbi:hypothetical protein [Xanthomonas phage Carpasina]|uniref:Uncharacterized protein n=1 Tax=Xanthomonas phage Carpasina TaxID=2163636 RepID=A0A2S1GST2_9CAUD|nr:hypothetical protein HOT16_gp14 [Xanthomonas phage Carpasina]AWD92409.1 hypothetical protein [Xanthomonas phage Carpasina]
MKDNDLIILLSNRIDEAIALGGWAFPLIQKPQPTQQGAPSASAVFFEKLYDTHFGSGQTKNLTTADGYSEKEFQLVETKFQVMCVIRQNPSDISIPTASDVSNFIKMFITSRQTIRLWLPLGVSVLKVSNLSNQFLENDKRQMEAFPIFDITLTHSREMVMPVGSVTSAEGLVIDGTR